MVVVMPKNKKKQPSKPRNNYVRAMMARHHGNQTHRNKREKRQNNPKNRWESDWDDDMEPRSKAEWLERTEQVKDCFAKVFGNLGPDIQLTYHEGDYADNCIDIDGVLEIGEVEKEVSTINGAEKQRLWQLFMVSYEANYHSHFDYDVNEVGVPHKRLDGCIREAVKLYAEHSFDAYMEHLADEAQAKDYEETAPEGPHSWKGQG